MKSQVVTKTIQLLKSEEVKLLARKASLETELKDNRAKLDVIVKKHNDERQELIGKLNVIDTELAMNRTLKKEAESLQGYEK